ncbi:rhodanese-like domain-containing protein [Anaeropeptidivorans aminofermentans]|uniref:rhodanese-like domain-containing protein n=1 Tax=Anaeropeptidivorans aminofermentans TaxID=2934315 RepID=UPI002024B874|nr:rhodanese-like domain-containing protein [Anaeropeptidivorans aminofermentans]
MKKRLILGMLISLAISVSGCSGNTDKAQTHNQPPKDQKVQVSNSENPAKPEEHEKTEAPAVDSKLILENLNNSKYIIVDTRINDAYNGWKVDGIKRGGHIPGAVDFSANWLNVEKEDKEALLQEALDAKGITPDKTVVLYDIDTKNAENVKKYLEGKGFKDILIYDFNEWINDDSLELEKYKNYQLVVPAYIVKEAIDGKTPESFEPSAKIKIVESSWGEESETYSKGHVPTAFHINTDGFEPPPAWMLDSDENLQKWALQHGFTADDTVIVTSADQMAAYRLAVVLRYIGVSDVRVLNGGNDAWTRAGYELETKSNKPEPAESFGADIPGNPDIIVTIPELKECLQMSDTCVLVDNRGWDEYIGESSGYSYHDKKGRIPGAVFGYAGVNGSGDLSYYRNIDNTIRNQKEIEALWQSQSIDTQKHMMFMCGSGWRAAEVLTYANVYGYENSALYSDGWIGWSNDAENPVEIGEPINNEKETASNNLMDTDDIPSCCSSGN